MTNPQQLRDEFTAEMNRLAEERQQRQSALAIDELVEISEQMGVYEKKPKIVSKIVRGGTNE